MACRPGLQADSRYVCFLGVTVVLLVFEIVISRLSNSLINMVDCFHTLFICLHLSLPVLASRPLRTDTASNPTLATSCPASPLPVTPAAASLSSPPLPITPAAGPVPGLCPALSGPYSWVRLRPLGAMVSALLLASLCASVSLDILSHTLQPHPIQRPLLAAMAGGASLLFNAVVAGARWVGLLKLDYGFGQCSGPAKGPPAAGLRDTEVKVENADSRSTSIGLPRVQGGPQNGPSGGALLFCNPGAQSPPSPDLQTDCSPPPRPPPAEAIPEEGMAQEKARPKLPHPASCPGPTEAGLGLPACPEAGLGLPACPEAGLGLPACPEVGLGLPACPEASLGLPAQPPHKKLFKCRNRRLHRALMLVQSLLASALVLANGLAVLLSEAEPGCQHGGQGCRLFLYLDPGFSFLAVLVLLGIALPQVWRYGSLLLQAAPPGLPPDELARQISAVPGILSIHHLHLWQLDEACIVASVHLHCQPEHRASGGAELIAMVTAVLRSVGVSLSTVQPEFHPSNLHPAHCTLDCGSECMGKMCCGAPPAVTSLPDIELMLH